MSARRASFVATLLLAAMGLAGRASAQVGAPDAPAARAEARDRFDRALRLFNEGDNAAALAEFKRVYELVPNPNVLFNIGLVYAALGRPVEAVEALDRLLAAPGTLSAERRAKALATRDEQVARVASLAVTVNVDGAAIEIDGVEIAKAPLAKPLSVSSGTHVVGAVAAGHAPARKEITVAGRAGERVALELLPMAGRLAHLTVKTRLPAASVVLDGTAVGRTPLAASITLPPGSHRVEIARAGYVTARQEIVLGDGASGELSFEPEEDRAAIDLEGSTLALAISQKQALITLDGRARGTYVGSLRVAPGVHHLRVERGGFLTYERDVDVAKGAVTTLAVDLYPGADTLAAYTANARFHRTWGVIGVVLGAALVGGAAGDLVYNAGQRSAAKAELATLEADLKDGRHPCASTDRPDACNGPIQAAAASYSGARSRDAIGYTLGGVGLAAIGAGMALLLTGDDPRRYDRRPAGELFAAPSLWRVPGGGGLGVGGVF